MVQFSINPNRFDPYKQFKFRIKWDGRYVAGVCKMSSLRRVTEDVIHPARAETLVPHANRLDRPPMSQLC